MFLQPDETQEPPGWLMAGILGSEWQHEVQSCVEVSRGPHKHRDPQVPSGGCIISGAGLSPPEAEPERIWVHAYWGEWSRKPAVSRIMAPKDVYVLIPGTCEYVTLQSKRDFAGVIEANLLK